MGRALRLALALPAAEPADLISAQRQFHLSAGVDAVIEAASEAAAAGADWLIEGGVGEFWWPRGGSLKELLEAAPAGSDAVQAVVRHFAPVAHLPFPEGMTYRVMPQAAVTNPASEWRPARKLVRRVNAEGSRVLRGWYPIEVLRFSVGTEPLDEREVRRGLAEGALVEDTRVRDALRRLGAGRPLDFPRPDVVDEAELALDVAALGDAEVAEAQARLDSLEARLAAVESTLPSMLKRKLRSLGRRSL